MVFQNFCAASDRQRPLASAWLRYSHRRRNPGENGPIQTAAVSAPRTATTRGPRDEKNVGPLEMPGRTGLRTAGQRHQAALASGPSQYVPDRAHRRSKVVRFLQLRTPTARTTDRILRFFSNWPRKPSSRWERVVRPATRHAPSRPRRHTDAAYRCSIKGVGVRSEFHHDERAHALGARHKGHVAREPVQLSYNDRHRQRPVRTRRPAETCVRPLMGLNRS
jgi:hypothetical protein